MENWCRCATREYPRVDPGCSQHGDLVRTLATDSATVFVCEDGAHDIRAGLECCACGEYTREHLAFVAMDQYGGTVTMDSISEVSA